MYISSSFLRFSASKRQGVSSDTPQATRISISATNREKIKSDGPDIARILGRYLHKQAVFRAAEASEKTKK